MKQIFTLMFVFVSFSLAFAQSYEVEKLSDSQPNNELNVMKSKFKITNKTSGTIKVMWKKSDISMPTGWLSNVCDPISCYPPATLSKSFEMAANASGDFFVDVTPTEGSGQAIVQVVFELVGGQETYTGTYTFGSPVANRNLQVPVVEVYPNPASNYFTVESELHVEHIEVINILGSKVLTISGSSSNYVDISALRNGFYFVRLSNSQGEIMATRRLQKN